MSRRVTVLLSASLVGVGVAVVVRTALAGIGGGLGLLLGGVLVLAGALRLFLAAR